MVDDAAVAYVRPDPLLHPPRSPSGALFTAFRGTVYLVPLATANGRLAAGRPRALFTSPRGLGVYPSALAGGWLIYLEVAGYSLSAPWMLFARRLDTGRVAPLDSSAREGATVPSSSARSDGRSVVWQAWTLQQGRLTSRVWSYDLLTGQRRLLLTGGSPNTFFYVTPAVSGHWVVFEEERLVAGAIRSQILLADLRTARIRPLTERTQDNSEPAVSGDLVVWKAGPRFTNGPAVALDNVRSGTRRLLAGSSIESPQVTAQRYVIFPTGNTPQLDVYDTQTGQRTTFARRQPDGYGPGNLVYTGGHMVAYEEDKIPGTITDAPNPARLLVSALP